MSNFKGYSFHNDVKEPAMRVWNRCQTAINIRNDLGAGMAESYVGRFDDISQQQMAAMFAVMHLKGEDYIRKQIFKGAI